MSDVTPPDQNSRYGHFTFARDSSDVAQWFRHHAGEHGFELDAAQTHALQHFERLYEELIGLERLDASLVRLPARKRVVQGIYLWGGVGRGKSFLMDSFFNCAPVRAPRPITSSLHGAIIRCWFCLIDPCIID